MTSVPHFALYGTHAHADWIDSLHVERIPDRASRFDWEIRPHVHDALIQVLLPRSGTVQAAIDGSTWHLQPPALLVVPAGCVHGFQFAPGTDGTVVTAAQRPLEAAARAIAPELLAAIRRPAVFRLDTADRHAQSLLGLVDAIEREAATHAAGQGAAGVSLLLALFVQIARLGDALPASGGARSRGDERVQRFLALLDAQFRTQRAVGPYAETLGVSAGQLTRLCRLSLGVSTLGAINARVVHEAQRELAYSSLSVKQIAAELGFADDAYFSRFFRKQTGQPPLAFRDAARQRLASAHERPLRVIP